MIDLTTLDRPGTTAVTDLEEAEWAALRVIELRRAGHAVEATAAYDAADLFQAYHVIHYRSCVVCVKEAEDGRKVGEA